MNRQITSVFIIGLLVCAIAPLSVCMSAPTTPTEPEPTTPTEPEPTPAQARSSNDQVTVIIDKVIRADVTPPDIAETLTQEDWSIPTPASGNDLVIIYLNIEPGEGFDCINTFGARFVSGRGELTLFDDEGHEYEPVRNLLYLYFDENLKFVEAEGSLVFELPQQREPVKLKFLYIYDEEGGEDNQRGEIDINLQE